MRRTSSRLVSSGQARWARARAMNSATGRRSPAAAARAASTCSPCSAAAARAADDEARFRCAGGATPQRGPACATTCSKLSRIRGSGRGRRGRCRSGATGLTRRAGRRARQVSRRGWPRRCGCLAEVGNTTLLGQSPSRGSGARSGSLPQPSAPTTLTSRARVTRGAARGRAVPARARRDVALAARLAARRAPAATHGSDADDDEALRCRLAARRRSRKPSSDSHRLGDTLSPVVAVALQRRSRRRAAVRAGGGAVSSVCLATRVRHHAPRAVCQPSTPPSARHVLAVVAQRHALRGGSRPRRYAQRRQPAEARWKAAAPANLGDGGRSRRRGRPRVAQPRSGRGQPVVLGPQRRGRRVAEPLDERGAVLGGR